MAKILDFTKTKEGKGVVYGNIGFLKLDELKEFDEVVAFDGYKHLFDNYEDIKKVTFIKAKGAKTTAAKQKGVNNGKASSK